MKLQIVGFEVSEGVSKKDGRPYSIGKLHTLLPLAGVMKDGNLAKGMMGKEFRCEAVHLRKIAHLPTPFMAVIETEEVMRFGEMVQDIVSVLPVSAPDKAKVAA